MSTHSQTTEFEYAAMKRDLVSALKIKSGNDSVWQCGLWASKYGTTILARIAALETERDAAVARAEERIDNDANQHYADGIAEGERRATAAIVAYLKSYGESFAHALGVVIERGEHLNPKPPCTPGR